MPSRKTFLHGPAGAEQILFCIYAIIYSNIIVYTALEQRSRWGEFVKILREAGQNSGQGEKNPIKNTRKIGQKKLDKKWKSMI